jgi:hypothetical protein
MQPLPTFLCLYLFVCLLPNARADSWARPTTQTFRSENGLYEAIIVPAERNGSNGKKTQSKCTYRQRTGETWKIVWEGPLLNATAPVTCLIPDSGRYLITLDEWHRVGTNPVIIYDANGKLIKQFELPELGLAGHPQVKGTISSHWWNEYAFYIFGPRAATSATSWQRSLEDTLFIRLHWGDVLAIDLASGRVRLEGLWHSTSPEETAALKTATKDFLDATWDRLAKEYFRPEEFGKFATYRGIQGLMLVAQLQRKEALPLIRRIAESEQFKHQAGPKWHRDDEATIGAYAQKCLEKFENQQ